jgi:lipopolysaccharide/colanic/teichoic acid biosynthesis glycosyltransferase
MNKAIGLTNLQCFIKRTFDIALSLLGLLLIGWCILIALLIARWSTGSSGIYKQVRVGKHGVLFHIFKIRTMRMCAQNLSTVTVSNDPRITRAGMLLRKFKIDEFPQLWNVLAGDMSIVGPRPDVPGFADLLQGNDLIILSVRPGITSPASLKYKNEQEQLKNSDQPQQYNRDVIFPDKVRINVSYVREYTFTKDLVIILKTIASLL